MNINSILAAIQTGAVDGNQQRLLLAPDNDFASKLTLGQMLKGKVLRHYEGSRYAVSFNGEEKIVDSSVPLRTGELLYGRVIGLDDKIQLQRVFVAPDSQASAKPLPNYVNGSFEQKAVTLFEQYQAKLGGAELQTLAKNMRGAANADLMAVSGLILSKIGLRIDSDLLRALFRVLNGEKSSSGSRGDSQPSLGLSAPGADSNAVNRIAIEQLTAALLSKSLQQAQAGQTDSSPKDADLAELAEDTIAQPQTSLHDGQRRFDDASDKQREWMLGRWLLNIQSDGSVAHRLRSLPIWFGDQLIEVDIALFSQLPRSQQPNDGIRYQKIVFSLDTRRLGHIEMTVHVAGRNLRIEVVTENDETSDALSRYLGELRAGLKDFHWQLDEVSYANSNSSAHGNVIGAVVQHYIAQDSLSRLL